MLKRFEEYGTIQRLPGSGRPSKVTAAVKAIVDQEMRRDDETTAVQLYAVLKHKGIHISLATILRARQSLGWTFRGSAYCQLIREANKRKRWLWVRVHKYTLYDNFDSVIWTDECSVQMETHRRHSCRKVGEQPRPKPR